MKEEADHPSRSYSHHTIDLHLVAVSFSRFIYCAILSRTQQTQRVFKFLGYKLLAFKLIMPVHNVVVSKKIVG